MFNAQHTSAFSGESEILVSAAKLHGMITSATSPVFVVFAYWLEKKLIMIRRMISACCCLTTFLVGGCTIVSSDGPDKAIIQERANVTSLEVPNAVGYALVGLSSTAVTAANTQTRNITPMFDPRLARIAPRRSTIGVGDTVNITIFEASAGGLFIPADSTSSRAGNFVPIPPQQVEANGMILVPYAGSIQASGRSPQQVARDITSRLGQRAVEPQVVVSVVDKKFEAASVLGDVNTPARLTIDPGGLRLLDAIARAGGPRSAPHETIVTVKRGDRSVRAALNSIVKLPDQNLWLAPGDTVVVSKEPNFFMALGATPTPGSVGGINNRRFVFENEDMSLTEAAAKAGGLDPNRADPRAVFLFRLEPRSVLEMVGVDTSSYPGELIPTIYICDFSKPDVIFLSNSMFMRSQDIIFVAEAPVVGLQRFTAALSGLTSNANAVASARAY